MSRPKPRLVLLSASMLAALLVARLLPAVSDAGSVVVARLGERALTSDDVEARLQNIGAFQLEAWGGGAKAVRHFVETALAAELRQDAEADRRKLSASARVQAEQRELLGQALDEALFEEESARPPSEDELRAFYQEHNTDYQRPRAIRVFRIVSPSKADAEKVIAASRTKDGLEAWRKLARESRDQATRLRDGDLGFLREDGSTDTPSVRVDPKVFAAADAVRDGELVPEPLEQGGSWMALWRRGTRPALEQPFESVKSSVRSLMLRERVGAARTKLLERLRRESLRDFTPTLVDELVPPSFEGNVRAMLPLKAHAAPNPSAPAPSEHGLR